MARNHSRDRIFSPQVTVYPIISYDGPPITGMFMPFKNPAALLARKATNPAVS